MEGCTQSHDQRSALLVQPNRGVMAIYEKRKRKKKREKPSSTTTKFRVLFKLDTGV
jgi:hypothetical protein